MKDSSMRVSEELLDELHEMKQGRKDSYEAVIWRLIEQSREYSDDAQETEGWDDSEVEVEVELADLELPGHGEVRDRREAAIRQMADLLRREGEATKHDFLELIDPDEVGYSSEESFWSNCVKGRESLKAMPGVVPPPDGMRIWRFDPSHG